MRKVALTGRRMSGWPSSFSEVVEATTQTPRLFHCNQYGTLLSLLLLLLHR
jgi:hypothetical protein